MPSIPLHLSRSSQPTTTHITTHTQTNPLPPLLHTPTGLALLELQGTLHFPVTPSSATTPTHSTLVGKLVFPLYDPSVHGDEDKAWMKRVYFYVGRNQRMTGECKKLARPFAVVRRRVMEGEGDVVMGGVEKGEELELVELVRYKVVFSARPEPVGGGVDGAEGE